MKVLILDFYLNNIYKTFSLTLYNRLANYNNLRLNRFIKTLKIENDNDIEINVITSSYKNNSMIKNVKIGYLPELRSEIEREQYIILKKNLVRKTKILKEQFLTNLEDTGLFHINGVFLGNLVERYLARFLNRVFGEIEFLNYILNRETYDKVIFFNYNPNLPLKFKDLKIKLEKIEFYHDPIIKRILSYSNWFFIKTIYSFLQRSLKSSPLQKKLSVKRNLIQPSFKNILFVANTKNQYQSLEGFYNYIKKTESYNSIFYNDSYNLSVNRFSNFVKYIIHLRNLWKSSKNTIFKGLNCKFLYPEFLGMLFYNLEFYQWICKIYSIQSNFNAITKFFTPSLIVIADDLGFEGRTYIGYAKKHKIPILFIPHASIPIFDELTTTFDILNYAASGQKEKDYYIELGVPTSKIQVTGRPRYEHFYKSKIEPFDFVEDMFTNRKYVFSQNDFTILLTTNPVSDSSNEKIISVIVKSLKKLNLIKNLIIKLHPREDGLIHKKVLKKLNVNPIIIKDYDILRLIKSCDLLLSRKSTTILEAFIIGIPVVVLDYINIDYIHTSKYLFLEEKDLITIQNKNDLPDVVEKLVNNKEFYQKYLNKITLLSEKYSYYNKTDTATEIIYRFIQRFLK